MDMEEDFPIKKAKARVEDSTHKKEREKARVKAIPRAVDVADLPLVEASGGYNSSQGSHYQPQQQHQHQIVRLV